MKTIITLVGKKDPSLGYTEQANFLFNSFSSSPAMRIPSLQSDSQLQQSFANVVLVKGEKSHSLVFNLYEPAMSLVTVYDTEGNIISIDQFEVYRNEEKLSLQNHSGNFIVRIQLKQTIKTNILAIA